MSWGNETETRMAVPITKFLVVLTLLGDVTVMCWLATLGMASGQEQQYEAVKWTLFKWITACLVLSLATAAGGFLLDSEPRDNNPNKLAAITAKALGISSTLWWGLILLGGLMSNWVVLVSH